MSLTKRARFVLCASLALVSLAVAAGGANAAPPLAGSGTFTYQSATVDGIRQAGGNTIIELSATVLYTGAFSGTSTLSGTLTLHPDGTANFRDVEIFTGTVNGIAGTATFALDGRGDASSPTVVSATAAIVSATGGLAGLHGVLHEDAVVLDPAVGPVGTYSGQIQLGANS
jgi:hypothetical protein